MTLSTSAVAACCSSASSRSRLSRATSAWAPGGEPRRALDALRPFAVNALRGRALAGLLPALERLFIASARRLSGDASLHPISARESRALRKLLREAPTSPYIFISERRAPLSAAGYQRMVARAGVAAKFNFLVHSHMLRHACGFKLANDGHDTRAIQAYLGHRSIMSTVRYTALTPNRFKNFWKD
jgi:hypothetical protein